MLVKGATVLHSGSECSNYIWMINNFIVYKGVTYIRKLTVIQTDVFSLQWWCLDVVCCLSDGNNICDVSPIVTRNLLHPVWKQHTRQENSSNTDQIDGSWWRHQMETCSALLTFCVGNSPVTSEFPHEGQWRGALMFPLIGGLNKRLSKQSRRWWFETPSCSLWHPCNA